MEEKPQHIIFCHCTVHTNPAHGKSLTVFPYDINFGFILGFSLFLQVVFAPFTSRAIEDFLHTDFL